jgi:hypothetical protein
VKVLRAEDRIRAAGATAVFVVHDDPDRVRAGLLRDLDVPFPVLVDPERQAYRDWGLRRASFARIYLSPSVWLNYARMLRRGERLSPGGRDPLQLGGDFVVGADGRLLYSRPQEADDRPPVAVLLAAVEKAGQPPTSQP